MADIDVDNPHDRNVGKELRTNDYGRNAVM